MAVFPGNVAQYVEGTDAFGLDTDRKRLVRLLVPARLSCCWALYGGGWWQNNPDEGPSPAHRPS